MTNDFAGIKQLCCLENQLPAWADGKAEMVASLLEGKRVLDVGCGIGTFSKRLSERGLEMTGLDVSPACIEDARRLAPEVRFLLGDVAALRERVGGNFDSALLLDVIEHVPDPVQVLKDVAGVLKPGGTLVLTVPAFRFLYSKHDENIGHFKRYSKAAVRSELSEAGFEAERVFRWNLPGFFGWLLTARIMGRDPTMAASPLVNSVYKAWLPLEKRVHMPLGNTLFAKARKRQQAVS